MTDMLRPALLRAVVTVESVVCVERSVWTSALWSVSKCAAQLQLPK